MARTRRHGGHHARSAHRGAYCVRQHTRRGHEAPGHFTKRGKWVPPHMVRPHTVRTYCVRAR